MNEKELKGTLCQNCPCVPYCKTKSYKGPACKEMRLICGLETPKNEEREGNA